LLRAFALVFGRNDLADNPRIPPRRPESRRPDRRDTLASRDRAGGLSAFILGLTGLDDFGLYVADIMALWKSARLAAQGEPAPLPPSAPI
jgi:hypothetical protein